MIKEFKDVLPGGLADESIPSDFDLNQLLKGIKHELEHTDDPKIAMEIAMDHLKEDPKYYDKLEQIEEIVEGYIFEMFSATKRIPKYIIADLLEKGFNFSWISPKFRKWDPTREGLTPLQLDIIVKFLKDKINDEKGMNPEDSASNFSRDDLAIAHVLGDKDNPINIQKAKILNISHLIDDLKLLSTDSAMSEHWDRYLDKVIDTGDELPWDNEEPGTSDDDDPKNPANIYKHANDSLGKVKAQAHAQPYKKQQAGVHRGHGPRGQGRFPGGTRQATSSRY